MLSRAERRVEVFKVHPVIVWVTLLAALLLQAYLPVKIRVAQLFDLPLLATIYFSLVKRSKMFGIGTGALMGLVQDGLTGGYIGLYGIAKTLVGYLAAAASVKVELESLIPRLVITGILIFVHEATYQGLEHGLLENAPAFRPADMASRLLVNVALGLILFQILDRFKHPA